MSRKRYEFHCVAPEVYGGPTPTDGRDVPVPPGLGAILKGMLASLPSPIRPERALLFPNSEGNLWAYTHWRRQILVPAREASGVDARAHELRHSWVSLLRAEGVPDVELARISGHSVLTMTGRYAHSVAPEQAFETIRRAVG